MKEAIACMYGALQQVAPEGDFSAFKGRTAMEANGEIQNLCAKLEYSNDIFALPREFTQEDDPAFVVTETNDWSAALIRLDDAIDKIVSNSIIMDAFSFDPYLVQDGDAILLDLTTSEKVNALAEYLETFTQKGEILSNVDSVASFFNGLICRANLSSLNDDVVRAPSSGISSDSEELDNECLELLEKAAGKFYISESLFDEVVARRKTVLANREYAEIKAYTKSNRLKKEFIPVWIVCGISLTVFLILSLAKIHLPEGHFLWWLGMPLAIVPAGILFLLRTFPKDTQSFNSRLFTFEVREKNYKDKSMGSVKFFLPALPALLTSFLMALLYEMIVRDTASFIILVWSIVFDFAFFIAYLIMTAYWNINEKRLYKNVSWPYKVSELHVREIGTYAFDYSVVSCLLPVFMYVFQANANVSLAVIGIIWTVAYAARLIASPLLK